MGGGGEGASGGWDLEVTVFWEGQTVGCVFSIFFEKKIHFNPADVFFL